MNALVNMGGIYYLLFTIYYLFGYFIILDIFGEYGSGGWVRGKTEFSPPIGSCTRNGGIYYFTIYYLRFIWVFYYFGYFWGVRIRGAGARENGVFPSYRLYAEWEDLRFTIYDLLFIWVFYYFGYFGKYGSGARVRGKTEFSPPIGCMRNDLLGYFAVQNYDVF